MNRASALLLLASGLTIALAAIWLPPGWLLPLWFVAQVALDFGWAGLVVRYPQQVQPEGARLALWLLYLSLAAGLLVLLTGIPLAWLHSGGGLPAFLALSAVAAGSVFLSRREHGFAVQILFSPDAERRLLPLLARLRERMWDAGDPWDSYWSCGFWVNFTLLLAYLAALTVDSGVFRVAAPLPQLGGTLLLLALSLWRVDRLLLGHSAQEQALGTAGEHTLPGFLRSEDTPTGEDVPVDAPDLVEWEVDDPAPGPAARLDPEITLDLDAELIVAVRRADTAMVAELLGRGASADAEPPDQARDLRSALVSAATCGQPAILRQLIAAGADLNRMSHGLNPLLAATRDCYDGRPDVVLMLLSNGADPRATDPGGSTPLHYAALSHDPAVAQHLLDVKAPLEAVDAEGRTPLGRALQAGNMALVELLLKHHARLEPEGARPVLLLAASGVEDEVDGVRRLLDAKARIDATDAQGRTALHAAAINDHAAIAELLLAAGAAVDAVDAEGRSAAMLAAGAGSKRVLRRLLAWKADARRRDTQGQTALHHAAHCDEADAELVDLLLALGCDPQQTDAAGRLPGEVALEHARWVVARRLDPAQALPGTLEQVSAERDLGGDRAALVIQSLAQQRRAVALELLALGALPPLKLAEAVRVAGDALDAELLSALKAAGLDLRASASEQHLLVGLCAQRPLPQSAIAQLLAAGACTGPDTLGRTPLLLLCGAGDEAPAPAEARAVARFVESLVGDRSLLQHTDAVGRTALACALQWAGVQVVALLLDAGANPNHADRDGRTPLLHLLLARRADAELLVRALVLAGADPARPAHDGATPRGMALLTGQPELLPLLDWPAGAHPGRPLVGADLAAAAQRGDRATVERLLWLGLPVNAMDERGASAALHAAGRGELALLQHLREAGADLRQPTASGTTPFGAAALSGRHAVLRWLIEMGCEVDTPQARGLTALALAAASADAETLDLLLDLGANPNHVHAESAPARIVLRALLSGSSPAERVLPVLAALLEAGADPNQPDDEGRTLLLLALGAGQTIAPLNDGPVLSELITLLQQHGAELNLPDRQGRTALHWVCRHGLLEATRQLVRAGADPELPDDLRKLPVDLASARNRSELHAIFRAGRDAAP